MVDRVSPEVRSAIMSRIRSKETGPEIEFRRLCREVGLTGYRKNWGRPSVDVAWPDYLGLLMDAPAVRTKRLITVMTEYPESWREILVDDLLEKLVSVQSRLAVEAVYVVDREEHKFGLAATRALAAVGLEDLAAYAMVVVPGPDVAYGFIPLMSLSEKSGTDTRGTEVSAILCATTPLKRSTAFKATSNNWRSAFVALATAAVEGESVTGMGTVFDGDEIWDGWRDFGLAFCASLHNNNIITCYPAIYKSIKVAVFIDSCFWHVCPEHGKIPDIDRWRDKLTKNVERDLRVTKYYRADGWKVFRFWTHVPVRKAVMAVKRSVRKRRNDRDR